MATETGDAEFGEVSRIKGLVFRTLTFVASWIGIVALVVLLAYVTYDALNLATASTAWYLVYAATVGVPTLGLLAYFAREPAAGLRAFQSATVYLGGTAAGVALLVVFVVVDPPVWLAYVVSFVVPTGLVAAVGYGIGVERRRWARTLTIPVGAAGLLLGATATGGMSAGGAVRLGVELLVPGVVLGGFTYAGARRPAVGRVGAYAIGAVAMGLVAGFGLLGLGGVFDLALPGSTLVYGAAVAAALAGLAAYVVVEDEPPEAAAGIAVPFLLVGAGFVGHRIAPPVAAAAGGPVGSLADAIGGLDPGIWAIYFATLVVPVGLVAGRVAASREVVADEGRRWLVVPAAVVAGALAGSALLRFGSDALAPGFPWFFEVFNADIYLVFLVTLLTPLGLYHAVVLRNPDVNRVGVGAPAVVVVGALVGGTLVKVLGIAGPESWIDWQFVTSLPSRFPAEAGLYASIIGSVFIIVLVAAFSFPLGVGAAIYLEEYAPETGWAGRLSRIIQVNISNLAGVPSVVYGLLGLGLFVNLVGLGFGTVLVAALTLSLLILPIVVISAQEAIRAVPGSQLRASYGMGATRWQTVRNVVLPRALPGILTGTILALGRAIGETAPLIMIGAPNSIFSAPSGPLSKTSAMPLQIFNWAFRPAAEFRTGVTAAGVVVLVAALLTMNSVAILVRNRYQRSQ